RWGLFNVLTSFRLPLTTGTGGQTKFNSMRLNLPKAHWIDAACVGIVETLKLVTSKIFQVKATGFGGRKRCQTDKFGYPIKHRPLRPIHGFSTGDIVRADVPKGKYKGTFTGRVCPMSHGYGEFVINGKRRSIKLAYLTPIHRKDGYSYG
ncbi:MAG TPA: HNH endonuclease, partial [Cyanobacteria bacterium UBA11159]|nr:HNH endonuclease [Cyanobacteria bacterium UBA11159]